MPTTLLKNAWQRYLTAIFVLQHELCFLIKLRGLYNINFIKTFSIIDFFSQNILFKTATFRYILRKKSVLKSLYRRVAVWTLQAYNFTTPS